MQLIGKVVEILPIQSGQGKNGSWKKQDIIIETHNKYPKKICIGFWNEKINDTFFKIGTDLANNYKYIIKVLKIINNLLSLA